jgi:hypothetical protein
MQINPVTTQAGGVISIRLQALFIGDPDDANDKALIAAYGDPQISLVGNGTFVGPVPGASPPANFSFTFPCSQYFVGITTQMSTKTVKFMVALPSSPVSGLSPVIYSNPSYNPNSSAPIQGPLDSITPYPETARDIWYNAMVDAITTAMAALRNLPLPQPLPPVDV